MPTEGKPVIEPPVVGTLFVVSTPIGNLDDMTQRGLQMLRHVDVIAAEDTRHSAKLLSHFAINTPMLSYHEHNERDRAAQILGRLATGGQVALVSDAGTPLICDPGYRLVRACHDAGYRVVPVPGACALTAAMSVAGVPCDRYYFEGFLPARSQARIKRLGELRERVESIVVYESCHRVAHSLVDMLQVFGGAREVAFCRELTKSWETVRLMPLSQMVSWVADDANQQRGEIVLVIAGQSKVPAALDGDTISWLRAFSGELAPARLAAVAARATGLKKRDIYAWLREHGSAQAD
jgi:16S rRNA (cytidine1402-2'-O)-methyltransferase